MYFFKNSHNVNQVEVSEFSLQSNTVDGKTEVPAESEVYDVIIQKLIELIGSPEIFNTENFHPLKDQMNYLLKVLHGSNRSCKRDYLSSNFVYRKPKDKVCYIYCALFLTEEKHKSLKSFFNVGYSG